MALTCEYLSKMIADFSPLDLMPFAPTGIGRFALFRYRPLWKPQEDDQLSIWKRRLPKQGLLPVLCQKYSRNYNDVFAVVAISRNERVKSVAQCIADHPYPLLKSV